MKFIADKAVVARQTAYQALNAVCVPVIAITALSSSNYGLFSLFYLGYAWASSLTYSLVCEAWARHGRTSRRYDDWTRYCGALLALCAVAGATVAIAGSVGEHKRAAVCFGVSSRRRST